LKSVGPSDEEPKMLSGEAGCADKPEDLLEDVLGFPSHPRRLAMISFRLNMSQKKKINPRIEWTKIYDSSILKDHGFLNSPASTRTIGRVDYSSQ